MDELEQKRQREQTTVRRMVEIYCRGMHGTPKGELCGDCHTLADYAHQRTERCPRMAQKTFCASCPTRCYASGKLDEIRAVMRYAGPRMLLYHPALALRHLIDTRKKQRKVLHDSDKV